MKLPTGKYSILSANVGWRLAFGLGVVLGIAILFVRRNVPESPRWLFIHGRNDEAEQIVGEIEDGIREETGEELPEPDGSITVHPRKRIPFREIARTALPTDRERSRTLTLPPINLCSLRPSRASAVTPSKASTASDG